MNRRKEDIGEVLSYFYGMNMKVVRIRFLSLLFFSEAGVAETKWTMYFTMHEFTIPR